MRQSDFRVMQFMQALEAFKSLLILPHQNFLLLRLLMTLPFLCVSYDFFLVGSAFCQPLFAGLFFPEHM